ncbi:MAG TPA: hypothetical protein VKU36_04900 [Candidatus Babeliales bacterium]|nr:hypothetical protein [Candidatus Babeliales bacterium]
MNITYIFLLSLICLNSLNAVSLAEELEKARNSLRSCQKSRRQVECNDLHQAYITACETFLQPLAQTMTIKVSRAEYRLKEVFITQRLKEQALNADAVAIIVSNFVDEQNHNYYDLPKHDRKSVQQYCNTILENDFIKNPKATPITDELLGIEISSNDRKATKERVMNIIKQM